MNSCESSSYCSKRVSSVCASNACLVASCVLGGGAFGGVSDCRSFALV